MLVNSKITLQGANSIVLIADIKEHPKVPKIEQMLSLGAAAQNILLSISSLGYGGVWRTGNMAFNPHVVRALELPENSEIIGYLYIGTPSEERRFKLNVENYLTKPPFEIPFSISL